MLPIIKSLLSLCLYNCMDKKKMSNFKVIHQADIKLQKRSEIYSKTAKLWKSGAALKSLGEKGWEIKGSGQEWLQWC